jgi:hypothetical protein
MTINIPRMLDDHASTTLAELDREISSLIDKLRTAVHRRAEVEAHLRLQEAFSIVSSAVE